MTNGKPLKAWSIGFGLTLAGVLIAFFWLDRPIAFFAHDHIAEKTAFIWMQRPPEILPVLTAVIFVWAALGALTGRSWPRFQSVMLMCASSYVAAIAVKDQLKYAFGRTWPETWINNNPSLIRDGAYGFNPFHGGPGFASFPSGHTVAISSFIAVLWLCYPRWRVLYAAIVAVVVIGLLGADFHFLSDIVAGGFLGALAGWTAVRIGSRAGSLRPASPPAPRAPDR